MFKQNCMWEVWVKGREWKEGKLADGGMRTRTRITLVEKLCSEREKGQEEEEDEVVGENSRAATFQLRKLEN